MDQHILNGDGANQNEIRLNHGQRKIKWGI